MAKVGRPKGKNNKEYNYTLRMDEKTKSRLELYCRMMNMTKSEVLTKAINEMSIEKDKGDLYRNGN